jgi:sugar phosphate isomerase/epimerase
MPHPAPPALSRRNFLAVSGAALAVSSLTSRLSSADVAAASPVAPAASKPKRIPIGLELYSVRTELMRNLPDTLRTVAKQGYEVVEFYAPYAQWTFPFAKGVRTLLDDLGMRCYSTHNGFPSFSGEGMAKAIELNQVLGCRHVVLSSAPGSTKGAEGWKELGGKLTAAVEQLKPHGLTAGFHNHKTEWAKAEGGGDLRIMDVLAASTPPEFVLQLDVGTCLEAGADPVAWIKANPGRIKSLHLKDWAPGEKTQEKAYRVLFGESPTPWKEIFAAAESVGGVEFYLIEQEGARYPEFETSQRCLELYKKYRGL